jgi:DNA-binding LytR/AlgR family response regulator
VTDAPPPSALREIRAHLTAPLVLATLGGVSLILAISGPFRTLDALTPMDRLIYWAAVVFLTYGAGTAITGALGQWPRLRVAGMVPRVIILSAAVGLGVSLVLTLIDAAVLCHLPDDMAEIAFSVVTALIISTVIVTLGSLAATQRPSTAISAAPRPAIILDRLPLDKRGSLVSLSAQDHYVRIATTKGAGIVLMRLSDAIREAGDTPGLQVHRAHWIARSAVVAARKTGETAVLTLRDGTEIPVSRRYVPALRDAGLLPGRVQVRLNDNAQSVP